MYQPNLPPDHRSRPSHLRVPTAIGLISVGLVAATFAWWIHAQRTRKTTQIVPPRVVGVDDPSTSSDPISESESASQQLALHPTLKDRRYDAAIRDVVVREDPVLDGWDTERFSEIALQQLNELGRLLGHPKTIDPRRTSPLCTATYESGPLLPAELKIAYEGPSFVVRRPPELASGAVANREFSGPGGFLNALRQQADAFRDAADVHFKFKIVRVKFDGATATTTAFFQMSGRLPQRHVQVNATWDCSWAFDSLLEAPQLVAIHVSDYEQIDCLRRSGPLFADCTESAFSDLPVLGEQLIYGRDHWYGNLEVTIGVEGRGNGIAIGDVDGNGLEDIYICQPAALPNRLFLRNIDGSLTDVSVTAGVDWLDSSRAALFVDIDNDGDQDLLLTQSTQVVLHENDGTGSFQVHSTISTVSRLFSMNAVDYDNDGDLDLFVCGYSGASQTRPEDIFASPVPYHDANNGAPSLLIRNDGNWRFTDVTGDVGLDVNNLRFSLASAWEDFDNDGDMDLYVANDFGRNNLYRNDDGQFVDVAAVAGVEDIGPGMSAAWGDYNNDGLMDIYVSNMFSSAGSRITHNPKFKPDATAADLTGFRRHARGNTLFENLGDGTFADRAIESGTTMGRWAWGSLFVDINNDGWRDVYVTNGFVTADNNNDL